MSGTGFFDDYEDIDTSSDDAAVDKKERLPTGFKGHIQEEQGLPDLRQETLDVEKLEEEFGTMPVNIPAPSEPEVVGSADTNWMKTSNNPEWAAINAARGQSSYGAFKKQTPVLCGWAAPPKSGKSGSIADSLTEEELANGAEIQFFDFDAMGESTKAAHHADKPNIVMLNPWVIDHNPQSRTPYNFPATYQKVQNFLRAQLEMADKQLAYFNKHGRMPNPYLKTVCFDGADEWLNICETIMKVDDLGLGSDGISVSGKPHAELLGQGRYSWNIRKNRYKTAIVGLQELSRRGVHCYLLTHLKKKYDGEGNVIAGAEEPWWLEGTAAKLQQVVIGEMVKERDSTGKLTGVVESFATLIENRTSLDSGGRVKIFRRDPKGGSEWHGWPGVRDGSFEHPDDVKDVEPSSE